MYGDAQPDYWKRRESTDTMDSVQGHGDCGVAASSELLHLQGLKGTRVALVVVAVAVSLLMLLSPCMLLLLQLLFQALSTV